MHARIALVVTLSCLLVPVFGLSAEEAAMPWEAGASKAEFDRLSEEWTNLLVQLRTLQVEYQDADEQRRAEIKQQWNPLIDKGEALKPQWLDAAEKAYLDAPNVDRGPVDLLVDSLLGHVQTRVLTGYGGVRIRQQQTDDFDEAWRLARLLIDNGCQDKRLFNAAGIAAFATQRFDEAEENFTLAREKNATPGGAGESLDAQIQRFLREPEVYKEAWAEEQEIRRAEAEADDLPRVLLVTSKGDIELELFEDQAPNTVANFISLVEKGFYNGLTFHRVLPGFMAQAGCPSGDDGIGGPGYTIPCECYPPHEYRRHFRGSLSMAKGEPRDTGGSQFFITFVPTGHLDGMHTVFGRVVKGIEVLHEIRRRNPAEDPNPPPPDTILKAEVLRKRDHEYVPTVMTH